MEFLRGQPVQGRKLFKFYGQVTGWMIVTMVIGLVVLLVVIGCMPYARKETVTGRLVAAAGSIQIAGPANGVISAVHVREGERVRAGQPLFTLDVDSNVEAGRVGEMLSSAADLQEQSAAVEMSGQRDLLSLRASELAIGRERLALQTAALDNQILVAQRQAALAQDMVERMRTLRDARIITEIQFRQYETTAAQAALAASDLQTRRSGLDQDLQQNGVDQGRLAIEISQLNAKVAATRSQNIERRVGVYGRQAIVITAPRDGRVANLRGRVGDIVVGSPIATIVDPSSPVMAEVDISTTAIGFVKVGTKAQLRYEAFPYERFGAWTGKFVSVSNIPEVSTTPGQAQGRGTYAARILPNSQIVEDDGVGRPLVPGTGVSVTIVLERRPIWRWALAPFLKIANQVS